MKEDDKVTSVRVKAHIHKHIRTYSNQLGITQGDLILRAINIAEKVGFNEEKALNYIQTIVAKEVNRIIGFIKVQDKVIQKISDKLESKNGVYNIDKNSKEQILLAFSEKWKSSKIDNDSLDNALYILDKTLNSL